MKKMYAVCFPRFRGTFVEKHRASEHVSLVTSEDHPDLTFNLTLLSSQPTYAQPHQHWQFVSDFAVSCTMPNYMHVMIFFYYPIHYCKHIIFDSFCDVQ